jgi:excisionase family DNA binding protein
MEALTMKYLTGLERTCSEMAEMFYASTKHMCELLAEAAGEGLELRDLHETNLYTLEEAAEILHVSTRTVLRHVKARQLRAKKIGNRTVIKGADILAFFETLPDAEGEADEEE